MGVYLGRALESTLEIIFDSSGEIIQGVNLNSEFPLLKIAKEGRGIYTSTVDPDNGSITIDHNLGYRPIWNFWIQRTVGGRFRMATNNNGVSLVNYNELYDGDTLQVDYLDTSYDTSVAASWTTSGSGSIGVYEYYYIIYYDPIDDTQ